jgi:trigger factor
MDIEIKEIEPCKLTVNYTADALQILNKRGEVLNAFKKAPVSGFRPGKVPLDAIKIHYKDQIENSLKKALAEDAYHNTVFEKKLRPHGAPRFNVVNFADGKFTCEFELFTKPDFELAPYKELEIPRPVQEDPNVLAEAMIQDLRLRYGEVSPFIETDVVSMGDNVILDYIGTIDGEKNDNLSAEGEMMTIGKSQLPTFDNHVMGMIIGDVREFDIEAPATSLPSIAGKTVHFKVTLNMGSRTVPAALDDEFAKKFNKQSYDELRQFVQDLATSKCQSVYKQKTNETVAARLVDDNNFTVPNWLAISEAKYLAHNAKLDWNTLVDADKEKYIELGGKNVKLSLVLDRIRELEPEAQLTDQEVFEVIKQSLAQTQTVTSVDDVIKEMNKSGYLQILFSRVRDENTMDFITKSIKLLD